VDEDDHEDIDEHAAGSPILKPEKAASPWQRRGDQS
jgi:hypothetical protein